MGRRLIRIREALRRMVGKPGRRRGIDRRKGLETSREGRYEYLGPNPLLPNDPRQRVGAAGPDRRFGKERRKK